MARVSGEAIGERRDAGFRETPYGLGIRIPHHEECREPSSRQRHDLQTVFLGFELRFGWRWRIDDEQ